MGKKNNNTCCIALFWLKAWFALSISFAGLGYFGYKVYDLRKMALKAQQQQVVVIEEDVLLDDTLERLNKPLEALVPTPIAIDVATCGATGARLEPPAGKTFLGFHLDWNKDTPLGIGNRLRYRAPSVM